MAAGDKVNVSVYNAIQSTIAPVLGAGSGDTGYGQTVTSAQISSPASSTKIKSAEWTALYNDILTCYNHQNSTNGTLTSPTTSTKVSAQLAADYQTMATGCVTNRLQFNSGYVSTASGATASRPGNTWGPSSINSMTATFTYDFGSYAAARYYFNTGSDLRMTASMAGSFTAGTKDAAWKIALQWIGNLIFTAHYTTNTGTAGTGSQIGFHELTGSFQEIYVQTLSSYIPNKISAQAKIVGAVITIYFIFEDLSVSSNQTVYTYPPYGQSFGPYGVDEYVTGAVDVACSFRYASGGTPNSVTGSTPTSSVTTAVTNV